MKKRFLAALLSAALLIGTCMPVYATSGTGSSEIPPEAPVEEEVVEPQEPVCTCPDEEGVDKTAEGYVHQEGCPKYVAPETPNDSKEPEEPVCTCPDEEGVDKTAEGYVHQEGCPKYVAPETPNDSKEPEEPVCTCPDVEGVDKTAEDYVHQEGCPLYQAPEEPKQPALVQRELTSNEPSVKVSGMIPEDVELVVTEMPMMATYSLDDEESSFIDQTVVTLDITLYNPDGTEWQPADGEKVKVTVDVPAFDEGEQVSILHYHVEEDESVTEEDLGIYTVTNGQVTFEMSRFSVIQVSGSTAKFGNVESFYDVKMVNSGSSSDQEYILGFYYDKTGDAHIIVSAGSSDKTVTSVTINNQTIIPTASDSRTGTITTLEFYSSQEAIAATFLGSITNSYTQKMKSFQDVNLGKEVVISGDIKVTVVKGSGGHNIKDAEYKVILTYDVQKTVYQVNGEDVTESEQENATVHPGDEVIFKIVATNSTDSEMNITGASLIDTLPDGVFDLTSVQYGTDLNSLSSVSSTNKEITLADANLTLAAGDNATYYVKATVLDTAPLETHTNTATLSGGNAKIEDSDTASITVTPPPTTSLTISKVCENPYEGDDHFIMTVSGPDNFSMKVVVPAGGSITISGLKVGETYTVTEDQSWAWRYKAQYKVKTEPKANGSIELEADSTKNFVEVENELSINQWLSGSGYCKNQWSNKGATINGSTPADN
ncbi:MAG: DUF5979 domain-containing protein [Negativibacillus sp.]